MSRPQRNAPDTPPQAASRAQATIWSRLATVVFLLPVTAVLLPTAIVLGVALLPALVALSVDRLPGRAFTVTVGLLNLAGSLPAVIEVWAQGHTLAAAQEVLTQPIFWMLAYLGAALGWMIFLSLPPILRRYFTVVTQHRMSALQKRQDTLRDVWGEAVTGHDPHHTSAEAAEAKLDKAAEDLAPGSAKF